MCKSESREAILKKFWEKSDSKSKEMKMSLITALNKESLATALEKIIWRRVNALTEISDSAAHDTYI